MVNKICKCPTAFFFLPLLWQALSKTLTVDELFYLKEQFALLEPNKNGTISLENIKAVGFFPYVFLFKLDMLVML